MEVTGEPLTVSTIAIPSSSMVASSWSVTVGSSLGPNLVQTAAYKHACNLPPVAGAGVDVVSANDGFGSG
ncbi:MAG: hypothetical protein ACRDYB_17075, partial [Acidimicrobiales bacterium]